MTTKNLWAILLAAGRGQRLARAAKGERKQFITYKGLPLFWHSVQTFARIAQVQGIVLVLPEEEKEKGETWVNNLAVSRPVGLPILCTAGGLRRQDSVQHGLSHLPKECTHVLVHDAARPFFSPSCVHNLLEALTKDVAGAIPGCPVTDTIKEVQDDLVIKTLERSQLTAVQTPQLFHRKLLQNAHKQAVCHDWKVTDDAGMMEMSGQKIAVIAGEPANIKITWPEDLQHLEEAATPPLPVTGLGYDVHKYGGNRPLVLGGIPIPGGICVKAHSDGDVLIHALCDAILGCLGQGDIGDLFPDSDMTFDNMPSSVFLAEVLDRASRHGLTITHVDMTIIAQIPKVQPFKAQIKKNLACLMALPFDRVNIKATTEEGLGFTGAKQGIKAMVNVVGTIAQ
ncbi:MAG: bifunctional 2-C-methyl-D-erythritol 4-phosphate cytidylyltransferase/2-C-methyl-D-erythritol 2,4-cyclodiphosphate synthase [Deltaproteobacteria bacterium]|nr:MAG: bifunctional 2-C-methyl-D-erythritol 4-phosphate cytidylyltransferase/2-C-methyl-D-erythritol 2,4-cyclodiphosphate synthase [Deltaproteobacteria bacterium]